MAPLSSHGILLAWERAAGLHPIDRGVTLLAAARPDLSLSEIADLPLGVRDAMLAELRLASIERPPVATAKCPKCNVLVEFSLPAREVAAQLDHQVEPAFEVEVEGHTFEVRLPTSRDLAAAAAARSSEEARRLLSDSCIRGAAPVTPEIEAQIAREIERRDPMAVITMSVACAECGAAFEAVYDPGEAFFTELAARAKRLLFEVHALARVYGWTEPEVLALGQARREAYLAMVGA
jgi:hypothetical protein